MRSLVIRGSVLSAVLNAGRSSDELDPWQRLYEQEWTPGRLDNHSTSVPMKDMLCEGPSTKLSYVGSIMWADVKASFRELADGAASYDLPLPLQQVLIKINQEEPDNCVLGITSTTSVLLPLKMPKFRNMARVLSTDQNFLALNVSFYDTLRSGFPVFGLIDRLASDEFRTWFQSDEALQFFSRERMQAACDSPQALRLLEVIQTQRQGLGSAFSLLAAAEFLAGGGGTAASPLRVQDASRSSETKRSGEEVSCAPGSVAALLSLALIRAQATDSGHERNVHEATVRDVIELVSRAEELLRNYHYNDNVTFGQLVVSPWNTWWLLHRLQSYVEKW